MGIEALKGNEVTFSCVNCEVEGQAEDAIIDVADIEVYQGDEDFLYAALPLCSKCKGRSFMFVGVKNKGVKAHMRRIIIRRAVENGQIREGTPQSVIDRCLLLFREFYDGRATETQKAEYDEKVPINLSIEVPKKEE
jgi:hypothetical protein